MIQKKLPLPLDDFLYELALKEKSYSVRHNEYYQKRKGQIIKDEYLNVELSKYKGELSDSNKRSGALYSAYSTMISLINFVFGNISCDKAPPRYEAILSNEEIEKFGDRGFTIYYNLSYETALDLHKCAILFYYIVTMTVYGHYSKIETEAKEVERLFRSLAYRLPSYESYNYTYAMDESFEDNEFFEDDDDSPSKRKTSENKRETLHNLYNKIILEKSKKTKNSTNTYYINDDEKLILSLLMDAHIDKNILHISDFFNNICIERSIADKKNYDKILESPLLKPLCIKFKKVEERYQAQLSKLKDDYNSNPFGSDIIFKELNYSEVKLWEFLCKLYYDFIEKSDQHNQDKAISKGNISLPENRQNWSILTLEDRLTLSDLVLNLNDNKKSFLKYIRQIHAGKDEQEYLETLAFDIKHNPKKKLILEKLDIIKECCNWYFNLPTEPDAHIDYLFHLLTLDIERTFKLSYDLYTEMLDSCSDAKIDHMKQQLGELQIKREKYTELCVLLINHINTQNNKKSETKK